MTYVALDLRDDDYKVLSLGQLVGMLQDYGYSWEDIKAIIDRMEDGEEVQLDEGYILFIV
ncbi:MAG: hypothetical protein L0154_25270 [Chloroflexi bacterium]|nr:hypothetical protein [Chloroflexota bacterium]